MSERYVKTDRPTHEWFALYVSGVSGTFVEIGSEHGGGSTAYLAKLTKRKSFQEFITIDFDINSYSKAKEICAEYPHAKAINGLGEDAIAGRTLTPHIGAAYLDNFDWMYKDGDVAAFDRQKSRYESHGMQMNNLLSQVSHLAQAVEIELRSLENCVIIFDDTWRNNDGTFNGKGGPAIPYLITRGFEVLNDVPTGDVKVFSHVIMGRGSEVLLCKQD
jgi:hypothetical protein